MAKQNIIEEIPDIAFDMTGGSLEVLIQYDRATQKFSIPEKALTVRESHQGNRSIRRRSVSRFNRRREKVRQILPAKPSYGT